MEEKTSKNKKQLVIGVSILLLVTLLLLGLTYAYYRTKIIGNSETKSVSLTSKNLEIDYGESSSDLVTNNSVTPGTSVEKAFTVTSKADIEAEFDIILDNINSTFTRNDWTYKLYKGTDEEKPLAEGVITNKLDKQIISREKITAGKTDSYKLKITYEDLQDVNQSEDMGATLNFRVNIMDTNDNIFADENQDTLLYAIGRDNPVVNPKTIPGQVPSASDEKELSFTTDDYGTSYYFRGKVDNNFVTMGNTCWRIVRVQGDGSIKITLYDETQPCESSKEEKTRGAFMSAQGKGETPYTTSYNDSYNEKKYVKYGLSKIRSALSDWYGYKTINLNTYDNQIEQEAEWCSDISESSTSESYIYFGAYNRLYTSSSAKPSLRCRTLDKGSEDNIYKYKIALLSADEIAFAGSSYSGTSWDYYLKENATGNWYWSLSPYNFHDNGAYVWDVRSAGDLGSDCVDYSSGSVRPAAVLKSNVTISDSGNGAKTSPYVIET